MSQQATVYSQHQMQRMADIEDDLAVPGYKTVSYTLLGAGEIEAGETGIQLPALEVAA